MDGAGRFRTAVTITLPLIRDTVQTAYIYMGILAQVFFDYSGDVKAKWFRRFSYTRAVSLSALMFTLGLAFAVSLALTYFKNHFSFPGTTNNLGIVGLLLMIEGFMTFTFTLILHSTAVAVRRR